MCVCRFGERGGDRHFLGTGEQQRSASGRKYLQREGRMSGMSVPCAGKAPQRCWIQSALAAMLVIVASGLPSMPVLAEAPPAPSLAIDFDALERGVLPPGVVIRTQFPAPDVVPGVSGRAWRTDGFSSYAEARVAMDPRAAFTLSAWVALESYPSDLEVPLWKLSPSSIMQQASGDSGYDLHIDTYGRWGFRIATSNGWLRVQAPQRFPLYRWTHVAVTVDPGTGTVVLYQDGQAVGSEKGSPGMSIRHADVPLRLATPPTETTMLVFTINRLNGAFDGVTVYPQALSAEQIASAYGTTAAESADAELSLRVPAERFASDALRPRVHPMPPANWTNEPHGLVRRGGVWHLFYQRTPNGPFKTQMHWGHMWSADLAHWQHSRDALWPELQSDEFGFDMKGIWSGGVILEGDRAFAFYTSVNHGDRLAASNPGVAMAVSEDPDLRDWRKLGPIINTKYVADFRDPFVWKDGDVWRMIIGAALSSGGGLDYYVLHPAEQGARWKRQERFADVGYHVMDPGSQIWEMPVFEKLLDGVSVLVVNPIGGKVSKYGEPATRAVYWTGQWSADGIFKPFFKRPKPLDLVPGHLAPTVARAADGTLRAIGIIDERRSPLAQLRAGWAHTFSLPRVWYLMGDGQTLGQAPAPELLALREQASVVRRGHPVASTPETLVQGLHAYEMQVELNAADGSDATLDIDILASGDGREYTRLSFDPASGRVAIDKTRSTLSTDGEGPQQLTGSCPPEAFGPIHKLRIFVDGSAIDVFVNDAAAYAVRSYPSLPGSTAVRLSTRSTRSISTDVQVWPLRPGN
jgi:beta-fructofuranosidase